MSKGGIIIKLLPEPVYNALLKFRGQWGPNPYRPWHDETESVFIHIPKTAGTSIAKAIYDCGPNHTKLKYFQAYDPKRYRNYFKFTVVRNPYDRFVSAVFNARKIDEQGVPHHPWFCDRFGRDISFNTLFERLKKPSERKKLLEHILFQPQYRFVADLSGHISMDYIGRFESLPEVLKMVRSKFAMQSPVEHIHKSRDREQYEAYFNPEGYELINHMYDRDFKCFDYQRRNTRNPKR